MFRLLLKNLMKKEDDGTTTWRIPSLVPKVHAANGLPSKKQLQEMHKEYEEFIKKDIETFEPKDPIERVKDLWVNLLSKTCWEYKLIQQVVIFGWVVGFLRGAVWETRSKIGDYHKRFNHMTFEGEFHARRKMTDETMLFAGKTGLKYAWRSALMPLYVVCLGLTATAYRNDINPIDFGLVASTAGAIYKFNLGPRAQLVTAGVMFVPGFITGCILKAGFWMSGTTISEFRYWHTNNLHQRNKEMSSFSWKMLDEKMSDGGYFRQLAPRDQAIEDAKEEMKKRVLSQSLPSNLHPDFFVADKQEKPAKKIDKE